MRARQANIFRCCEEAMTQINDAAVLVASTHEVVNQPILLLTGEVIKHNQLLIIMEVHRVELFHHSAFNNIILNFSGDFFNRVPQILIFWLLQILCITINLSILNKWLQKNICQQIRFSCSAWSTDKHSEVSIWHKKYISA